MHLKDQVFHPPGVGIHEVVAPAAAINNPGDAQTLLQQNLGLKPLSGTPPAARVMTAWASSVITATAMSVRCEYRPLGCCMSRLKYHALWLLAKLLAHVNLTCTLDARPGVTLQGLLQQLPREVIGHQSC